MNFTDTIATAKASVLQELRRKRKWQTYVVASGLTLCFFLVVGNVLGESANEPKPETAVSEESSKTQESFQLTDNRKSKTSVWEASTGAETAPKSGPSLAATEPVAVPEPVAVAEPVEASPAKSSTRVVEIAAAKAEAQNRNRTEKSPLDDVEQATKVATDFYAALNDGHAGEAYDKLAPEFQAVLPFENFQYGYRNVESIYCEVKHSEQIDDNHIRLDVQIDAYEDGDDTTYYATCILWKTDDQWSIAGAAQLAAY
jgi:hypothetical protein